MRDIKGGIVTRLSNFKRKIQRLKAYASLNTLRDLLLFFYLTKLIREFTSNDYINNYEGAEEGIKNVCFDYYIKIIKRALNLGVK